jgi:hypothetical protein
MNRITLFTTLAAIAATYSSTATAQTQAATSGTDQALVSKLTTTGGYGAAAERFSTVAGNRVVFTGMEGGWIANSHLVLGAAGYGLATQNVRNAGATLRDSKGRAPVVEIGYGGITLGYLTQPTKVMHLELQTLIGGGGMSYDVQDIAIRMEDIPGDAFFVAEPSLYGELNVTSFLRIGVGGGYRFVAGASLDGLGDRDLRGASASLQLKLGRF